MYDFCNHWYMNCHQTIEQQPTVWAIEYLYVRGGGNWSMKDAPMWQYNNRTYPGWAPSAGVSEHCLVAKGIKNK